MTGFANIQGFIQEYADNIAELLGLDVTILDEDCVRISGTGAYQDLVGQPAPKGSFFETVLKTGKPGVLFDTKKNESQCSQCKFIDQCTELATIGFPIFKKNKAVGVIGIIGFSSVQKETIISDSTKLLNFLSHMSALLENKLLVLDLHQLSECQVQENIFFPHKHYTFDRIIGHNTGLVNVTNKARKVMNSISTVLISGESGTGKELLAQSIHYESHRSKHSFISVNCAALPENLIESELFGYEGGAFTGSKREGNVGKFELAHKGTIFLDEIGDLPFSLQPKLLRVLQERSVDRIGGRKSIPVDVRVIAATNKDLGAMVKNGTFREDLYYRINVIPLNVASLRERRDDIVLYLKHFINKYGNLLNKEIVGTDPALEQWVMNYDWPGNIRQLENAVEYMVNMAETVIIGMDDLPDYLLQQNQLTGRRTGNRVRENEGLNHVRISLDQMVSDYEREILLQLLDKEAFKSDKAKMAQELSISLSTLYRKLEKYQLG
jgi:transcriptional regulator with PAS, ATPase and Fis domain